MNVAEIREAFDRVFDEAVVFHGFADYLRDYDVFVHVTADPRTGIAPQNLRYRFKHCVRATVTTALSPDIWLRSLDEQLVNRDQSRAPDGFVWAVRWQNLYPGMTLVAGSPEAHRWAGALKLPFHEATIGTNGQTISLVFADLTVDTLSLGHTPFVVTGNGPDFEVPRT